MLSDLIKEAETANATIKALIDVHSEARILGMEEAAKIAEAITKALGQRNAKDQWRESIGQEIAAAIRAAQSST